MPNRCPVIDPFALREGSKRIPTSVCLPIAWLSAIRRHADSKKISVSEFVADAVEAHSKTAGLELPEVKR